MILAVYCRPYYTRMSLILLRYLEIAKDLGGTVHLSRHLRRIYGFTPRFIAERVCDEILGWHLNGLIGRRLLLPYLTKPATKNFYLFTCLLVYL